MYRHIAIWILMVAGFSLLAHGQATKNICAESAVPPGWVVIHILTDPNSCGGGTNNIATIEQISTLGTGATVTACSAFRPRGWALKDVQTDFNDCSRTNNDMFVLLNLDGFAVGTEETVCGNGTNPDLPAGWVVVNSSVEVCPPANNKEVIRLTPVANRFVPVTPCRIADTRNPSGPFGGPFLTGGVSREFDIAGSGCAIPDTALAYALNVTVVPKAGLGFLAAYPCPQVRPTTSNLNSDGRVKAVAAIVPATASGTVCVFVTQDTDVILDISGYFVPPTANPNGLVFYPMTPCRMVDTRNPDGTFGGPALAGAATRTFPLLSSTCHVPSSAQAYSLNFTTLPANGLGFFTAWPAGQAQPGTSILNAQFNATAANAAIVTAGTNGGISVFATQVSDVIIDINGYFAPPASGGLSLFTVPPCRILDTRNPAGSPPINGTITVNVAGSSCGAPTSSEAYVLNATVIPSGLLGFLELWPNGTPESGVSTLNAFDGVVTSNMAIVSTNNGLVNALASAPTHLVLDISGYFAP